jgi:putative ABC transport system permease protein
MKSLKHTLRALVRNPSFSLGVLLCLVLGVGASSAMFSVVSGVLLEPLPFEHADRVSMIYGEFQERGESRLSASGHELLDYRDRLESFDSIAAATPLFVNLTGRDQPAQLVAARVSADLFPLLGVEAERGRLFRPEEDVYGQNQVTVLSHELWQRSFGGDPDIVGQVLTLNEVPYEVIGIVPPELRFGRSRFELYVPIAINLGQLPPRQARGLDVYARRAPGVSPEAARAEVESLGRAFAREHPGVYPADAGWRLDLVPVRDDLVGDVAPTLLLLMVAVLMVLVVACVNVANLLLARATAREKEMAIRTALGARRSRLMVDLLVETLMLSFAGTALGLLAAHWAVEVLVATSPARIPRLDEVGLDWRVLLFAIAVAVTTGVVFGLLPLAKTRNASFHRALKEGGKTSDGAGGGRVRSGLVALEIAVALVVLVAAGLLVRNFTQLEGTDPGFEEEEVFSFRVFLPPQRFSDQNQRVALVAELVDRLETLPGVSRAGAVGHIPLARVLPQQAAVTSSGGPPPGTDPPQAYWTTAGPGYFDTLEIPLLAGRDFTLTDDVRAASVAIVDQTLVDALFPDAEGPGSAVGRTIRFEVAGSGMEERQVVGVVGPVRQIAVERPPQPQIYVPHAQKAFPIQFVVARTARDPNALTAEVRSLMAEVVPDQPLLDPMPLVSHLDNALATDRFDAWMAAIFALVALLLAVVGVYGVMSYQVAQSSREMGVRMAIGGSQRDVLRLVIGRGMRLAALGLAVGLGLALVASRLVESSLYGVEARDFAVYAGTAALLAGLAFVACWLPARRATRVDPLVVLRSE